MIAELHPRVRAGLPSTAWWRPQVARAQARLGAAPAKPRRSLAFGALVGFTFVLLLAPQEHFPALGALHLAVLTSIGAAVAQIHERSKRGQRVIAVTRPVGLALTLGLWAAITIPFSMWPGGSIDMLFGIYLKSIAIFVLLGAVVDTGPRLRKLAWALTLFAVPLALTAVSNYLTHKFVAGDQAVERIVGYQAPLSQNPNDLALLLNLILPLSAALFLTHRGAVGRAFLAFAIALDAGAVVATFSRAGFLTLAFVFLGLTWKLRKRPERVWTWGALALALLCVLLLPAGYLGHLGTITNISADATGSAQERSRDMLASLTQIAERPLFGAGLGMNILALNAGRGATWHMVHNVYLQYAADLGLPGLLLFLMLFWSCMSGLSRALKQLRGDGTRTELFNLAEGVQLSLCGFALAAFFHPVGYHFPFFYLAGLAVAVRSASLGRV